MPNALTENNATAEVDPDIKGIYQSMKNSEQGLSALKFWLTSCYKRDRARFSVAPNTIQDILAEDIEWCLSRIRYMGQPITTEHYRDWSSQFPADLQWMPHRIVTQIATKYYVDSETYIKLVMQLASDSKVGKHDSVAFVRWQREGKSSNALNYSLHKMGRWNKIESEFVYENALIHRLQQGTPDWIVIADDFIGSGETLEDELINSKCIEELAKTCANSKIRILALVGILHRVIWLRDQLKMYPNVSMLCAHYLGDEDRCFESVSTIFPDSSSRQLAKKQCEEIGLAMNWHEQFWFGYGDCAVLTMFHDRIPDNSLPILWNDDGGWIPLLRHPIEDNK